MTANSVAPQDSVLRESSPRATRARGGDAHAQPGLQTAVLLRHPEAAPVLQRDERLVGKRARNFLRKPPSKSASTPSMSTSTRRARPAGPPDAQRRPAGPAAPRGLREHQQRSRIMAPRGRSPRAPGP